jgi:hypothetical protein
MSSTMTTNRIPAPRLGATIRRWAPVLAALVIVLGLGVALVQSGATSARSTESRSAVVDNSLRSPCRHQMTATAQVPICGAASAADVATGYIIGRPHGFVHRQARGNCIMVPKRGRICAGR